MVRASAHAAGRVAMIRRTTPCAAFGESVQSLMLFAQKHHPQIGQIRQIPERIPHAKNAKEFLLTSLAFLG